MTPEFWAIIGVGISLAALNMAGFQMLNKRIDDTNKRFDDLNKRFDDVNQRIGDTNQRINGLATDIRQLTARVTELEKGQARIEGILDGLREALFERAREIAVTPSD